MGFLYKSISTGHPLAFPVHQIAYKIVSAGSFMLRYDGAVIGKKRLYQT
jgi:hypothetical protein